MGGLPALQYHLCVDRKRVTSTISPATQVTSLRAASTTSLVFEDSCRCTGSHWMMCPRHFGFYRALRICPIPTSHQ